MDRFKAIESFTHVVKTGSFSKAAGVLGLSRAMVSRHVQDLERRLQARLLNRTTRSIKLTEIGATYLDFCQRLLTEMEVHERSITHLRSELVGSVKIAAAKSFGSLHVSEAVTEFSLKYPQVTTTLILDDYSIRAYDFVERGLDLAIRIPPVGHSAIIARKLGTLRWGICAAPSYLDKYGEPKTPRDLTNHKCLARLSVEPHDRLWRLKGAKGLESIKVDGPFFSNSALVLRHAVLAGIGIGLLPWYCIAQDLNAGRLVQLLAEYKIPERPLCVLYPHARLMAPAVRGFVEFLTEWFKKKQNLL
jgi:DNA-binding transcriptional LysR family regulator